MIQADFLSWTAACRKCGKILRNGVGLFCSNFLMSRGSFHPCGNAWCGECYTSFPTDPFPQQSLPEEEEGIESDPAEVGAYQRARNGDHLMGVPFECDLCHFRNIRKKDPNLSDHRDAHLMMVIRRASLDACWARASSTVGANLKRATRDTLEVGWRTNMQGHEMVPRLGWPHLEDRVGMAIAVQTLTASLRPGKYANHLQYESLRRTTSWWNNAYNAYNAGTEYMREAIFAQDAMRMVATTSPTRGEWYARFMRGVRLRQGEIRVQDLPFTSKIVLALDSVCEGLWSTSTSASEMADLEDFMCFVLMEFCGDLRGEEVPLLSLAGILQFWEDSTSAAQPFIMLTLHGRFKGETGLRWHCIPIPVNTKSQLPNLKWISRAMDRRVNEQGRTTGWFFANKEGKRRKMAYYDTMLQEHLAAVQERFDNLIPESVDIEGFSLRRSGRSGAHTEATNNKVPENVIKTMGRWRVKELAKGTQPGLPMTQVYLRVSNAVPTLLAFASGF